VGAVLLFTGAALVGLLPPLLLGRIVDRVLAGDPSSSVIGPAVAIAVASLGHGLLSMAAPAVAAHATEPALADLREGVVDHALRLQLDVVEEIGTGELVARTEGDVEAVGDAVRGALPEMLDAALTIAISVVGIAALDWRLGVAAMCAAPIQLHTLRWYLPRSNPLYAAERRAAGARSSQLLESVSGSRTIRELGGAGRHRALVEARSRAAADLVVAATRLRTRFFARLNLAELVGLSAILGTGYVLVDRGDATVGAVTAAALFFQRLFDPVNVVLFLVDEAQIAGAALARLVGITQLAAPTPPGRTSDAAPAVDVDGVTYAYRAGHDVLHGIALHVRPGEKVAVVGATGAGKSTLAKLVAAVHSASDGAVHIAGVPVPDLARVGARLPVVLVTQEIHVFAGTLADDLRLAAPAARDDDLHAALAAVGAAGWVDALPDGVHTVVGEGGHVLTPTQAQHLALARLVLTDPAVAVLDEATAETGSAGARALERAGAAALDGRTAVVVAHRLSQAAAADRVLVLDGGRIVEQGTHDQLLALGGAYADLWQAWTAHGRGAAS
jgi:ATP-binding cassette subfamily C protein